MIMKFSAKCSDMSHVKLVDGSKVIWDHEGDVPYGIGLGGGDYVKFEIDTETGQILNWEPIDTKKLISGE